ncbi:MAG: ABC transporter ATP-binding protein, partial [Lachnospiraceae bacterium]|nr:ABC transporter ATP-binding protein [Lachnospiraceae bacterium]
AEYGITIILSSHILSEVESIADTIGVIDHGTLRKEISMQEISEKNTAYIELAVEDTKKASYVLADKLELKNFKVVDGSTIRSYDDGADTGVLSKTLALNDIAIQFIGRKSESLEDYFLKVTGEGSGL